MTGFFVKVLSSLTNHKKKAISVLVLASSFIAMQYTRRSKKFEAALKKLEQKVQSQLEKEFKEKAELYKKDANYDEVFKYFEGLNKALKNNIKTDISNLFKIDQISSKLRDKSLSPEEKNRLWANLKEETISQAVFTLVYIPLSKAVLFIRECIINDKEALVEQGKNQDYFLLETFLADLTRLVIPEGGTLLAEHVKSELKPIIEQANVKRKYKKDEILDFIDDLKKKILSLNVSKGPGAIQVKDRMEDKEGVRRILGHGKKKGKKPLWKEGITGFPEFTINAIQSFISTVKSQSVHANQEKFKTYFMEVEERQEKDDKFLVSYKKESQNIEGEEKREGELEEKKIELRPLMLEEEEKKVESKVETEEEKFKKKINLLEECGDEFLDLLESRNLNLWGLYTVAFEFEKLKNRIILFFKSKETEEMLFASFLPCLQKIIQEEFISEDAEDNAETFYHKKIKACLGYLRNKDANEEEMEISYRILREAEMKREVDNAFKEFGKKIYMGKDYEKVAKRESREDNNGLELLLNGLTKTSIAEAGALE